MTQAHQLQIKNLINCCSRQLALMNLHQPIKTPTQTQSNQQCKQILPQRESQLSLRGQILTCRFKMQFKF